MFMFRTLTVSYLYALLFQVTYFIGILFTVGACVWFWFMGTGSSSKEIYGAAILNGIGGSTMLVTSLAMCSDLISSNTVSCLLTS